MNIAGKVLGWFNTPNQQLAGEIISNLIPEPSDLPGILQKRDDELYELYKQRTNPQSPGDPLAPPIELAKGTSVFSTPGLDKQEGIRKYLENDQKIRDLLIKRGKMKAFNQQAADFLANYG